MERKHEKIPYRDIEPLLNLIVNQSGSSESQVLITAGYSSNAASDWRKIGMAPVRAKYILLGLAAEMKVDPPKKTAKQFSYEDLRLLFALLIGLKIADADVTRLSALISTEMSS